MVSTPLLATQGSLIRAIQLTLIPTLGVNVMMLIKQSNLAKTLRPIVLILPATSVGTVIGSLLILKLDPEPFRLLLATAIVLFLWLDYRGHLIHTNPATQPRGMVLSGLAAGILVGSVNVGVPVLIIFVLYNCLDRYQSIVIFNSCILTGKLTQLVLFGSLGELNSGWQQFGIVFLVIAIFGVLVGQRLGERLDQKRWRAAMRWVLLLIAGGLVVKFMTTT